ncbi:MAG: RAMP superfamily CRISPR-associated protein [Halothece sp.]
MLKLPYRSDHRHVIQRVIVRGTLVLDTPTCLGTGDADSPTDMPVLRDNLERNKALLTGSSIAGALRNYLREYSQKYGHIEERNDLTTKLFGDLFAYKNEKGLSEQDKIRLRENDSQSSLIIDDGISTQPIQSELRDGVKINSITRTAADKAKYDLELLQAGTEFPLCFELLIDQKEKDQIKQEIYEAELRKGLAIALSGLEKGEISLGMKKRRGFGRCHVKEWQVWNFDLTDASDRMAWLTIDHSWSTNPPCTKSPAIDSSIVAAMKKAGLNVPEDWEDQRDRFTIDATFTLASPLLIRSGQAETGCAPDVVHLKSHRHGELKPILSGTSLAGVLRHRAERIVKTLQCSCNQNPECNTEPEIIKSIFGDVNQTRSQASRLIINESVIHNTTDLVQTRIAIDRFTGGTYHGALFQEQPVFGNDNTEIKNLEIELRNPKEYEIGLLLLLLKDLWTEDLPVGGGSSVGRGRLRGKEAKIEWKNLEWKIKQNDDNSLHTTPETAKKTLQNYVSELVTYIKENNNNEPSNP